jgi:hypothetical protein
MKALKQFIFYNNTIPLAFGILFLGAGATFAASEEARGAVVQSQTALVSIDNSYLLNTPITESSVSISINSVTENEDAYFVEYFLNTLGVKDGMWQPILKIGTLTVRKEEISGRDLGLYAEEELAEVHAAELRLLQETKIIEQRAGLTPKVLATEYSGLVGQFFDPGQEVFPGYDPLISPDVGIPLTREQEATHREIRRLLEEQKRQEAGGALAESNQVYTQEPSTGQTNDDIPTQDTPPAPEPAPEPPSEQTPAPEQPPEPAPELEPTPAPELLPEPAPASETQSENQGI